MLAGTIIQLGLWALWTDAHKKCLCIWNKNWYSIF